MRSPGLIGRRAPLVQRPGRVPSRIVCAAALALAAGATFYFAAGDAKDAPQPQSVSRAGVGASPEILYEDKGRIEVLRRARLEALSALEVQPLFENTAHATPGQTTTLRFAARDRVTGKEPAVTMTAVLLHGNDEPVPLAVNDKGNGQLEIPVNPRGLGRYDVELRANGIPVGTGRIGVAGSAGGGQAPEDFLDYTADMRAGRFRPGRRGSRRR